MPGSMEIVAPTVTATGYAPPVAEWEALSALIAAVYDAAIEPERWSAALGSARDFIGGMAAALYAKKHSGLARGVYHDDGGISDDYKRLYTERYAQLDPATPGELSADLEQPVSTGDILDYDEFLQSRFYLEWQRPQGMIDFICAPIDKAVNRTALFSVFRHERDGMIDDGARSRMRLLAARVVAARSCEDGGSFVDTFRLLTREHGFSPAAAWNVTTRVHQSGGFTRDLIYLRGLIRLLAHLRRGGELDMLYVGKIAQRHLPIVQELLDRGVLQRPPLIPRVLQDPEARGRLEAVRAGIDLTDLIRPEAA